MMDKNEAVKKLSTVGRLSMSYAEDLYDSFFEKPVVPQYVADWYEKAKDSFNFYLVEVINNIPYGADEEDFSDFEKWIDDEDESLTILVNMHQFGYEVEKEKRYRVSMPKTRNRKDHAQLLCEANGKVFWCGEWYRLRTKFTRKELEQANFGWVFDCEGIEIEEVK